MGVDLPATTNTPSPNFGAGVLHVFVLSSFALAQPLYDLLGRHAAYFVARDSEPIDVIVLVLALSLILPAILAGCLWLTRILGIAFYRLALAGLQIVLVAGIVLMATNASSGPVPGGLAAAILVPIGLGLLFAMAYRKLRSVPLFLTIISPAILIFPAFFLFATPVSKIVFPGGAPTKAGEFSLAAESHVVFLVFDLLPLTALMDEHQNLDAERYPGFARMQAQSVWFRRARTVRPGTVEAIPALLTGRYPSRGALALLEDHPNNLFTLFGTVGGIHAHEPVTRLCPETLCREAKPLRVRLASLAKDTTIVFLHLLLPESLTDRLPPIDSQWGSFDPATSRSSSSGGPDRLSTAGEPGKIEPEWKRRVRLKNELDARAAKALASLDRLGKFDIFLEGLGRRAGRNLSFLHLDFPHSPFVYLSSGRTYISEDRKYKRLNLQGTLGKGGGKTWGPDPYLVALAYQRLTHQIGLVDKQVARLLDRLEALNSLDRSLIVITADHGQNYEPNRSRRSMTDADTAHIPLFIKYPGQREGMIDDRAVETVDILPTIVDALDLDLDWQFDGYSLEAGSGDASAVSRRQPPELERDLVTSLRQKLDRVGSNSRDIPGAGPHQSLIGQRVADVLKDSQDGVEVIRLPEVELDQQAFLSAIDPSSDFVPAYLTGSIGSGGESSPLDLAIAVNGVIQATLTTHQTKRGATRFAAMVPESSFAAGSNSWAIFRLHETSWRATTGDTSLVGLTMTTSDVDNISPSEVPLFADGFESGDTAAWQ